MRCRQLEGDHHLPIMSWGSWVVAAVYCFLRLVFFSGPAGDGGMWCVIHLPFLLGGFR